MADCQSEQLGDGDRDASSVTSREWTLILVLAAAVAPLALLSVRRPGARAISERTLGARQANAAAQASTARPEGASRSSARPWPCGAESPGQSRFSWSCNRCRSILSSATSWRRCRTTPSNASSAGSSRQPPRPCCTSQTSAAQSQSSDLKRRYGRAVPPASPRTRASAYRAGPITQAETVHRVVTTSVCSRRP